MKMYILLIILCFIYSCSGSEFDGGYKTMKIGVIKFPSKERVQFEVNRDNNASYYLILKANKLIPFLNSNLQKCKSSKDQSCLLRSELGNLKWKLTLKDEVIYSGDIDSIEYSLHEKIALAHVSLTANEDYQLVFEPSTGYENPINTRSFSIELYSFK